MKGRPCAESKITRVPPRGGSRLIFGADAKVGQRLGEGLGLEHHAFAAAKGTVIDGAVTVVGEGAQIVHVDRDAARLPARGARCRARRSRRKSRERW